MIRTPLVATLFCVTFFPLIYPQGSLPTTQPDSLLHAQEAQYKILSEQVAQLDKRLSLIEQKQHPGSDKTIINEKIMNAAIQVIMLIINNIKRSGAQQTRSKGLSDVYSQGPTCQQIYEFFENDHTNQERLHFLETLIAEQGAYQPSIDDDLDSLEKD